MSVESVSEMTEVEIFERFTEGLKKSISRFRELGRLQENQGWGQLAFQLEALLKTGTEYYNQSPLTRQMALNMIDEKIAREQEGLLLN